MTHKDVTTPPKVTDLTGEGFFPPVNRFFKKNYIWGPTRYYVSKKISSLRGARFAPIRDYLQLLLRKSEIVLQEPKSWGFSLEKPIPRSKARTCLENRFYKKGFLSETISRKTCQDAFTSLESGGKQS